MTVFGAIAPNEPTEKLDQRLLVGPYSLQEVPLFRAHHVRNISCQWATTKPEAARQSQRQLVGLARVRFIGGTLQSFVRCSSDALSLRRSFPVLTGAAIAASSWPAAEVAEQGVRLTSRNASMIRCMRLDSIMPGAPLHHPKCRTLRSLPSVASSVRACRVEKASRFAVVSLRSPVRDGLGVDFSS
jgi:hypothetical protein